jgi:PAS domain S-box-containing protein
MHLFMKNFNQITILLISVFITLSSVANDVLVIDESKYYNLASEVDFLLDAEGLMSIDDVRVASAWQGINRETVNFGFISSALWLKFRVKSVNKNEYILHIPYPLIDKLDHYGFINDRILAPIKTGDSRPFHTRALNQPNFVFPYSLDAGDILTAYIRVETSGSSDVPMKFSTKQRYLVVNDVNIFFRGIMNGVLILLLIYNLFIYFGIRNKLYLIYVAHVLACIIASLVYDGTGFENFWPNSPEVNNIAFPFFNSLIQVTSIILVMTLLHLFQIKKWYVSYFKILLVLVSLIMLSTFILPYSFVMAISIFCSILVNLSALILSLYLSFKGSRSAQYFSVAILLFLTGMVTSHLKAMGLLPTNFITQYASQIGLVMEMIVLALALTQKLDASRKAMITAQKDSIINLKRYKDLYSESLSGNFQVKSNGQLILANPAFCSMLGYDSLEALSSHKISHNLVDIIVDPTVSNRIINTVKESGQVVDFEYKIKHVSGDYVWISLSMRPIKNSKGETEFYEGVLVDINDRKKNEQLKEKATKDRMNSIEQLVIGVCHELNTPLGSSITGLSHLKDLITDMESAYQNETLTRSLFTDVILQENDTIELTQQMLLRVGDLIKQFKHISVTQLGFKREMTDIKQSVDTGIAFHHELIKSNNINVNVVCGQALQVETYGDGLMEIIKQLVQNSYEHGFDGVDNKEINIEIWKSENALNIAFSDSGVGLSDKGKEDLFNPFYTTMRGKQGKTGLGMYMVYNLVTQLLLGEIILAESSIGLSVKITIPILQVLPIHSIDHQRK